MIMYKGKNNKISLKAIIIGTIALFIFGIFASIFDFWLLDLFPNQAFKFLNNDNISDVLKVEIIKQLPLYFISTVIKTLIRCLPAAYLTAYLAKRSCIYHGVVIGIISSVILILSILIDNEQLIINVLGIFLFFEILLGITFSALGGKLASVYLAIGNSDGHGGKGAISKGGRA